MSELSPKMISSFQSHKKSIGKADIYEEGSSPLIFKIRGVCVCGGGGTYVCFIVFSMSLVSFHHLYTQGDDV